MEAKRVLKDIQISFISLVAKGANNKTIIWKSSEKESPVFEKPIEIKKIDNEKRIVYGIVYSPGEVDSQGDVVNNPIEIENAAYAFMQARNTTNVDKQHDFDPDEGFVAESWITKENDPLFADQPIGSWAVGIKVLKEDTWIAVKSGEITGLSMAGVAHAEDVAKAAMTHNSKTLDAEPDWAKVNKAELPRIAFADMGDPEKKSTWKYPHHWVSNGKLYLHKGGLNAAWQAANGARSGQKADQAIIDHLQKHRKAIGLEKSDFMDKIVNAVKTVFQKDFNGEVARDEIRDSVWKLSDAIAKIMDDDNLEIDAKRTAVMESIDQFKTYFENVQLAKEGKIFSKGNYDKIKAAHAAISELIQMYEKANVQKGENEMTPEEITQSINDALNPITERLEKLEKAEPVDVAKAVKEALTPVAERLEKLEKAAPGSTAKTGQDGDPDPEPSKGLQII